MNVDPKLKGIKKKHCGLMCLFRIPKESRKEKLLSQGASRGYLVYYIGYCWYNNLLFKKVNTAFIPLCWGQWLIIV